MTNISILNASFKGAPFFVDSEKLARFGRSLAKHEYPNTSEQFAEDTGGFAREFEVEGFVIGLSAKDQLMAVINACNEPGPGRLVLPFFGERQMLAGEGSVSVRPYLENEKLCFTIQFSESRTEAGFVAGAATLPQVLSSGQNARDSIKKSFAENFTANKSDPLSMLSVRADLQQIVKDCYSLMALLPAQEHAEYASQVGFLAAAAPDLVGDNLALSEALIGGIYTTLSTGLIGAGNEYSVSTLSSLSSGFKSQQTTNINFINAQAGNSDFILIGENQAYWPENTRTRRVRNETRRTLSEAHRLNLILIAYELLAGATFDTDTQADAAMNDVEMSYIDLLHGVAGIKDGAPIQHGDQTKTWFLRNKNTLQEFERTRLLSIAAAAGSQVVRYKTEIENSPGCFGSSILNLAYLTQAESLTDEKQLTDLALAMRGANNRKTYFVRGDFTVLRGAI